jgi:hypothetical protein
MEAREIAEKLFTTTSGARADKLIQADAQGATIDELDYDTVVKLIEDVTSEESN